MKKAILMIVLASGWFILALILVSEYFLTRLLSDSIKFTESAITWDDHVQFYESAVQCNLLEEALEKRKAILKQEIFSKVIKRVETKNSIVYFFDDEGDLLKSVLEHVQIEKACCPFFKFDVSILPFGKGFALEVSGSEEALEMIHIYESNGL